MGTSIYNNERKNKERAFSDFPLVDADLCVKCGLCLPHCPTYKLSLHEGDSPRGRIALMQALAQDLVEPRGSTTAHLDGCLVCRACEPVCPAQVPYGRLIDKGREGLWRAGHRPGWLWRLLAWFRRTPVRIEWLTRLLRFAKTLRLGRFIERLPLGRLARSARFLERAGKPPAAGTHTAPGSRASVALFLGCVARSLDHSVLHASVTVLNAMGFDVEVSGAQGCCGAMDAHAGDVATTCAHARANIRAFEIDRHIAVIATASGCGVQLHDYPELNLPGAASFATKVQDVMHFISTNPASLPKMRHSPARVVIHATCTLKNGMRQAGVVQVLQKIEGLQVERLDHQDCCGAAGSYLFEHPDTADQLGHRLLDAMGSKIPDIFVTSNIGCALHLRRLAFKRGLNMEVAHPVELLARSIQYQ